MKKSLLSIFIIIMIFSSCNNENSKSSSNIQSKKILYDDINFELVNIPKDIFETQFDLSSSVSNIEFLALETNEKCLIGRINKIISDTTCYIIHDKNNNSIYRFDKHGRFLNQIGEMGGGPKEFMEARDVSLTKKEHELAILDLKGRKIVYYTFDGKFIGTTPLKFLFTQFEFLTEDHTVFNIYKSVNTGKYSELSDYKLAISDKNLNPIGLLPYKANPGNTYTTSNPLRNFLGEIYYAEPFYNRIFVVNENGISPSYKFKFDSNGSNSEINFDDLNDQEFKRILEYHAFFNGEFVVSDSVLVFGVIGENKGGTLYYSLNTKELKFDKIRTNAANRFQMLLFRSPIWLRYDNKFVSTVDPYEFLQNKKYVLDGGLEDLNIEEKNILLNANESDNPILMFYNINKF